MSLQELRNCQLLDTVEHRAEVKRLSEILRDDEGKRASLASDALGDESVFEDYQLCMDILSALGSISGSGGVDRGGPVCDLALRLSDSVFRPVRAAAVSSGLLSDEDALRTLLRGRPDLSKPLLQARIEGRYGFDYTPEVGAACDRVYGERAALFKVLAGADLTETFRASLPAAKDMRILAKQLPPRRLLNLVGEVDGLLTADWLKVLLRRCEALDPAEEMEAARAVIDFVLYHDKWHPDVDNYYKKDEIELVMKYLWRRQGPSVTAALASYNSEADPALSLDALLRLSKYTSFDEQIAAFHQAKDRFGRDELPLHYIKRINKSSRSKHCSKLLELLKDATDTPQDLVQALQRMIANDQIPPIALSNFVAPAVLEAVMEDTTLLTSSFEIGRTLLQRPRRPAEDKYKKAENVQKKRKNKKTPPAPFVEYMSDPDRIKLFSGIMLHRRVQDIMNGDALVQILGAFAGECADLGTLREGTSLFVRTLGESVRPDMLLDASSAMSKIDAAKTEGGGSESSKVTLHACEGLPFELLRFVCEAGDPNGALLLDHISDEAASTSLVARFGRPAWWDLLLYGLGRGLPPLQPVKTPRITQSVSGRSGEEADDFIVVESNQRVDEVFENSLLNECTGRDLDRRREGLRKVLQSCHNTAEFRLQRLSYVIKRVSAEPEMTKQALVPVIFRTIRGVREWVHLALELSDLWEKCVASSFSSGSQAFRSLGQQACCKVVEGLLKEDAAGAQLAARVTVRNNPTWIVTEFLNQVGTGGCSPAVLTFLLAAALETGTDIITLIVSACKKSNQEPQHLLDEDWAAPLRRKLKQCCENPEFVLIDSLKSLTQNKVKSGWTPVKDDALEAAICTLKISDEVPSAVSLLSQHLASLSNYKEKLELASDALARTEKNIDDAGAALLFLINRDDMNEDTFKACAANLFSSKVVWQWEKVVSKALSMSVAEAVAEPRVFKWNAEDLNIPQNILRVWFESTDGMATKKIATRPDALDVVIISDPVAQDLVSFKPMLLRKLVQDFQPQTPHTVKMWEKLATTLQLLLKEAHLPIPTATELADVMKSINCSDSTLCLARLLREVDSSTCLLERMEAMEEVQDVTNVIIAAVEAGHPLRTAEIIMRGTDIKEQLHRTSLERSLSNLPVKVTQNVIKGILSDEKTGPSVAKICLRLFEKMHINEPEEILLAAWRDGRCHREVDTHIKSMYAQQSAEYSKYQDLIFDAAKVGGTTRFVFVVRELIEMLSGKAWSSKPLIRFLSKAIDEGAVKANTVFHFMMQRMCLETGHSFDAADEAIVCLTQLVSRGRSLADRQVHGLASIADSWRGCSADNYQFYSAAFVSSMKRVEDQSRKQDLILALAGNQPAGEKLLSIWAQVFLTGGKTPILALKDASFGFRLCRGDNDSLLLLSQAATKQAVREPSDTVTSVALSIVEQVHAKTRCDEEFLLSSATLAALSSEAVALIAQFEAATAMDAEEAEEDRESTDHHYLIKVLETVFLACPDRLHQSQLEWLRSKRTLVIGSDPLVSASKQLAIRALQTKSCRAKDVATIMLEFRTHSAVDDFDKILMGFDRTAMLYWVRECVRLYELEVETEAAAPYTPPGFHDAVMRTGAAEVLAGSSWSHFRLRALGHLPARQVETMAEQDEDYGVRAVARVLMKQAKDQSKLAGVSGDSST